MTIGQKLQELRKKRAMSQESLAEKLSVTRQTVSKWELDQSTPDVDMLVMISDIFDVSLDSLMRKNEMPTPRMVATKENTNTKKPRDKRLTVALPLLAGSLLIIFILFIVSLFLPAALITEGREISGFEGFLRANNIFPLFGIVLFIAIVAGGWVISYIFRVTEEE